MLEVWEKRSFFIKVLQEGKTIEGQESYRKKTHRVSDTSDSDEVVNALTEKVNRLRTSESNKALVTFMLSGRAVKFQIDTGSTCNVLPFHLYAQITGDRNGRATRWCSTIYRRRRPRERLC